jgi:hypothetical protein
MAGKRWKPKSEMKNVGGERGKLHREIGVPEGEKIPAGKLKAAEHSKNPEIKRDSERAETMKHWKKPGAEERRKRLYDREKD